MPRATSSATAPTPTPAPTSSASAATLCLVGNHDLAVLGALDVASFSEAAAEAVAWTRENIAESTLEFLRELEPTGLREGIALFHASPRDPVWEYVLSVEQAYECMQVQPEPVALIGHSHVSLFFALPEDGAAADTLGSQAGDGSRLELDGGGRWLVNPGSVGQPRDGDPRAAWLELDLERADRRLPPRSPTTSTAPRRRSSRRACRSGSRIGSTSGSEPSNAGKLRA